MYKHYKLLKEKGDVKLQLSHQDKNDDGEADVLYIRKTYHPDTQQFIGEQQQPIELLYLETLKKDLLSELKDVELMIEDYNHVTGKEHTREEGQPSS